LADNIFLWEGKDWPPNLVATGQSIELQCRVEKTYPLHVRRAKVQQGYLKGAHTGDVLGKYHVLTVEVLSSKLSSGAILNFTQLSDALGPFILQASGGPKIAPHLILEGQRLTLWGNQTLVGDVRTQPNANQVDPLGIGTVIKVTTVGSSLLIKECMVVSHAPESKGTCIVIISTTTCPWNT